MPGRDLPLPLHAGPGRVQHQAVVLAVEPLLAHLGERILLALGARIQLARDDLRRISVDPDLRSGDAHRVARQADQALDEHDRRLRRLAEHDHVAARRLADLHDARVQHRQAQPVAPLVDEDEVALDQRRHHGIRRDAERLVQEGAQRQHDDDHREEGARVVDQQRLADDAAGPALRREPPAVEAPDGAGDRGQDHQHECEIEDHQ